MRKVDFKLINVTKVNFILVMFLIISSLANGQELIQDKNFQQGFYVRDRVTAAFGAAIRCDTTLPAPVWDVCEWGSKTSVLNIPKTILPNGMCKFADPQKDFRFGPIGAEDYQLYFGVNSLSEYDSIYRVPGQAWPHLLVEQRLSPPYDFQSQGLGCPPFSNLDSLIFQIDAKLYYNQTIMTTGYDPSLHAAQFLIYFTVQNLNSSSAGYGKYVWLGVPIYDDRTAFPPGYVSYDIGTQTLINSIPYTDFASVSMHSGNWVHVKVDLMPYAIAALDTAWAHGFLNQSTNIADYKIGGINLGWELPGMSISTVAVDSISLFAYADYTGVSYNDIDTYNSVNMYPNPAKETINISNVEKGNVYIYNVLGKEVLSTKCVDGNNSINVSSLVNGSYVIKILSEKNIITKRLIMNK